MAPTTRNPASTATGAAGPAAAAAAPAAGSSGYRAAGPVASAVVPARPAGVTIQLEPAILPSDPLIPDAAKDKAEFGRWLLEYMDDVLPVQLKTLYSKSLRNLAAAGNDTDAENWALRATTTSLNLTRACNLEAALMTVRGTVAAPSCTQCAGGSGPFQECRVFTGVARGSCNNCHYNSSGSRCSFRPDVAPKTRSIPKLAAAVASQAATTSSRKRARLAPASDTTVQELVEDAGFSTKGRGKLLRFLEQTCKVLQAMDADDDSD